MTLLGAASSVLSKTETDLISMAFNVDKYLYDVIIRVVTYGGSNNVMKNNISGLNLKVNLGKCFYRSTFRSLYSYI